MATGPGGFDQPLHAYPRRQPRHALFGRKVRNHGRNSRRRFAGILFAAIHRAEWLNAEIWDIAQSVVEAVGEIGGADHQRQFHDLPFVVELPQFIQRSGTSGGGTARDTLGVQDGGFILVVEQWAALVELQRLDLLVSEPDSLRRSDVGAGSILAAV